MWIIGIWISGILIEDYLLSLFGVLEEVQNIVPWSSWQSQEAHPMIARIQNQGWEELPSKFFPSLVPNDQASFWGPITRKSYLVSKPLSSFLTFSTLTFRNI